jgi:hypothetical protein
MRAGRLGGEGRAVPGQQRPDCCSVALGKPKPLRMLIDHEQVAVTIGAAQEHYRVVREPIVQGGEPFAGAGLVEVGDDVNVPSERGEELAGGDVPIAIEPGTLLPAAQSLEHLPIFPGWLSVTRAGMKMVGEWPSQKG